eukprot:scaffold4701_cov227-Ochromonas_danica.AAC.1
MLARFVRRAPVLTSKFSTRRPLSRPAETEEWIVFPRETEGNIYTVNLSLLADGVTSQENAYQNARLPLLLQHLPTKVKNNQVEVPTPLYQGAYQVKEAGDSISHDAFVNLQSAAQDYLTFSKNIFVEDATLGTVGDAALGARVVTTNPALALIARSLLVPAPPRAVNQFSRCKGWNLDPRVNRDAPVWDGEKYVFTKETVPRPGQRPIVALVGGPGNTAAVQFLQHGEEIVGATIIAGDAVPVSGLVEAFGHALVGVVNENASPVVALPATAVVKKGVTTLIVGKTNEDLVKAVTAEGGEVYAYAHSLVAPDYTAAVWNGVISAPPATSTATLPTVIVNGQSANILDVDNATHPVTKIVFLQDGQVNKDEALKQLVALADGKKEAILKDIVGKASISSAKTVAEAAKLL